ncbi:MAG TPA: xanthine dehydrogenase family protein molybdopterin-binding subunit [Burkholderiales bacterium]|nr:xanthine dehydrogenase family protein molybdopterin-binding subunit [Burkholderiales bacterium]
MSAVGRPILRKEDQRLLTGAGRFTDDFNLPGQAYAAMVRSPYPHARILHVDIDRARAMAGVFAVYTGADCAADGLLPIPHNPLPSTREDMKLTGPGGGAIFEGPHRLLPADKVRHVGEAVAMVVAETKEQAADAAESVSVEYEELPWVTHSEDALAPGATAVWDEAPDNVLVDTVFGDRAATERGFARADRVVRMKFNIGRCTAVAIEPRAALGAYDPAGGRYTLYAGSGGAVRQKSDLAAVLGIEPGRLRVLTCDVGGNFGSRNRAYVEYGLALWASRRLGRPVKFTASRSESFLSDYQGRDLVTEVELALCSDGTFLALRASNLSNIGARCISLSPLSKGSGLVTGAYDIPAATLRSRAAFTNTAPTNPYRSSGRPEVTFAIERLIDAAAAELGIDRVALRRKNLVRPEAMPYRNAVGMSYDSGTYEANMDAAMKLADWNGFDRRREAARARGKLLGRGLANYVESSIGSPRERAEITVTPAGRVRVVIGTQPSGQGHETSFAQVIAMLLSVSVDAVDIVLGDTDVVSVGGGSHSGRSMRHAATVFSMAAEKLIENGKRIAAFLLETDPERVEFAAGRFSSPGARESFDFLELAREAGAGLLSKELKAGLAVAADSEMHDPVFPNGCAICECEVDPETGAVEISRFTAVDDVGRCINPMIVHGQTHGGAAQGIGQALSEIFFVDPETGQPNTGSLMDYAIPRSDTLPFFTAEIVEVLSPTNPLGIKAAGEGATTPAPAAVINAIVDAIATLGVRDVSMPATPEKVWRAIREAGK